MIHHTTLSIEYPSGLIELPLLVPHGMITILAMVITNVVLSPDGETSPSGACGATAGMHLPIRR